MTEHSRSRIVDIVNPEEQSLKDKKILITGASRDVGAGIFLAAFNQGAHVVGIHRDPQKQKRAQKLLDTLSDSPTLRALFVADITKEEDRKEMTAIVSSSFGNNLDALILNASGPTRDVNVDAARELVDWYLPKINRGGKILLMQSVAGHFFPSLSSEEIPDFYYPIAEAKYEGEMMLRSKISDFDENGVTFIVVCPPEVKNTSNMLIFKRRDPDITRKNNELSHRFGLPESVTVEDVGNKVVDLLVRQDLPQDYIELFQ